MARAWPGRPRVALGRGVALAALATLVAAGLPGARAATTAEVTAWQLVPSPNMGPGPNVLRNVAAVSSDDAWAVGSFFDEGAQADRSLIEHWDGRGWTIVPAPTIGTGYQALAGVAALSAREAWAVGYSSERFEPTRSLILRWNGRRWRSVDAPAFEQWSALEDVSAVSGRDVWAVGNSYLGSFIIHWDGRSWRLVPSPNVGWLTSIHAVSANDVWVVGQRGAQGGAVYQTLTQHWDGNGWSVVPSPSPPATFSLLEDVSGRSSDLVWAVGSAWDGGAEGPGPQRPIIARWDGAEWRLVPGPDVGEAELFAVVGLSGTEAWAVGRAGTRTLIVRWDGTGWTAADSPSPGAEDRLQGVAALASGEAWAVGVSRNAGSARTLALRRLP